jgi:hypothetical protein
VGGVVFKESGNATVVVTAGCEALIGDDGVVHVVGDVDTATAPLLRAQLMVAAKSTDGDVVVDLADVSSSTCGASTHWWRCPAPSRQAAAGCERHARRRSSVGSAISPVSMDSSSRGGANSCFGIDGRPASLIVTRCGRSDASIGRYSAGIRDRCGEFESDAVGIEERQEGQA